MPRRVARILLTGMSAASAVILTATSAVAQETITVTNPNSDGSYAASAPISDDPFMPVVRITNFDTGASFACIAESDDEDGDGIPREKASDVGGIIQSVDNAELPYTATDAVTSLAFNNCMSNFGGVVIESHYPYNLVVETFPGHLSDGTTLADGVGRMEDSTEAPLASITFSFCSFDVVGEAPATYLNADNPANDWGTGALVLDPNLDPAETGASGLTATNVSSCLGQFNNGDALGFDAVYAIDDPTNPSITITST